MGSGPPAPLARPCIRIHGLQGLIWLIAIWLIAIC